MAASTSSAAIESLDRLARTAAVPQDPDALALLGQVDQLEVAGERPDHVFGSGQVELGDQLGHAMRDGRRWAGPRYAIVALRSVSTWASSSGPPLSAIASPSIVVSSLTSLRNA